MGWKKDRAGQAVLTAIADAANRDGENSHPGVAAMIDASGYAKSTVFGALERLTTGGWVVITEEGGGRGNATVYAIPGVMEEGWRPAIETVQISDGSDDLKGPAPEAKGSSSESETVQLSKVAPITQRNEQRSEQRAGSEIEQSDTGISTITTDAAFDAFWAVFPKRQGKAPARKAFAKALTKTDAVTLIRAAAAYRDWPGRNPDMTKMAQGWLSDERWNDELPAEARHDEPTQLDKNRTELMKGVDRLNDPAHIPFAERMKRAARASHPASAALSAPPALRALPGGASPSIPTEAREAP